MTAKVPGNLKDGLPRARRTSPWITGLALVTIGVLALVAQFFEIDLVGLLFLPALGLIFLLWGMLARRGGLLIPGGILIGLGVGTLLVDRVFSQAPDTTQGGVIMLAFAGGWVLVTLVSVFFAEQALYWPLIPALIMGVIGGALVADALGVLSIIGTIWPVFLILGGLYFIIRRR